MRPRIAAEADVEGKGYLYADGDTKGVEYDAREVAGGDQTFIFGGFQAKNREFVDSLKTGEEVTTSPFRDCLKTMEVAEKHSQRPTTTLHPVRPEGSSLEPRLHQERRQERR